MSEVWDFCVVGAGSGGVRAARRAAALGVKTLLIEDRDLGGTCVNRGCIPKKLYVYAGAHRGLAVEAASFGWHASGENSGGKNSIDLGELRRKKAAELSRLRGLYEKNCREAGVEILHGTAKLVGSLAAKQDGFFSLQVTGAGEVEGAGEGKVEAKIEVRAKKILLATGGEPVSLKGIEGAEIACVSDAVFELDALPKRVVVLGGGYIALECAGIFNALGAKTTLVHRNDVLLRSFDRGVVRHCLEGLVARGVDVRLSRRLLRLSRTEGEGEGGGEIQVDLERAKGEQKGGQEGEQKGGKESLCCDFVLAALGRKARTRDLGLEELKQEELKQEELKIATDAQGKIITDENFATSQEGVYALGDATPSPELTPIAIRQAEVLVSNLFGGGNDVFDARVLPRAVFATPALASVGFSEEEARVGGGVRIYESSFTPLRSSFQEGGARERVFVKLIERAEGAVGEGEVLGCHMVGSDAPEIIQSLALGLQLRACKKDFDSVVALHPTNAEEFMTLRDFRE